MRRVLTDSGPLFAIFSANDPAHETCVEALREIPRPLVTTWPVLTEVVYLLRGRNAAVRRLLEAVVRAEWLTVAQLDDEATPWFCEFFERFHDHEAQLADAAIVYLAEREGADTVFTLDRRDSSIYRTSDGRTLDVIPESSPRVP